MVAVDVGSSVGVTCADATWISAPEPTPADRCVTSLPAGLDWPVSPPLAAPAGRPACWPSTLVATSAAATTRMSRNGSHGGNHFGRDDRELRTACWPLSALDGRPQRGGSGACAGGPSSTASASSPSSPVAAPAEPAGAGLPAVRSPRVAAPSRPLNSDPKSVGQGTSVD